MASPRNAKARPGDGIDRPRVTADLCAKRRRHGRDEEKLRGGLADLRDARRDVEAGGSIDLGFGDGPQSGAEALLQLDQIITSLEYSLRQIAKNRRENERAAGERLGRLDRRRSILAPVVRSSRRRPHSSGRPAAPRASRSTRGDPDDPDDDAEGDGPRRPPPGSIDDLAPRARLHERGRG
jgi:hypothetical protein